MIIIYLFIYLITKQVFSPPGPKAQISVFNTPSHFGSSLSQTVTFAPCNVTGELPSLYLN